MSMYCSHTSYNIKTIMLLIPHHENICMQKYLGVMPFMNSGETYISLEMITHLSDCTNALFLSLLISPFDLRYLRYRSDISKVYFNSVYV